MATTNDTERDIEDATLAFHNAGFKVEAVHPHRIVRMTSFYISTSSGDVVEQCTQCLGAKDITYFIAREPGNAIAVVTIHDRDVARLAEHYRSSQTPINKAADKAVVTVLCKTKRALFIRARDALAAHFKIVGTKKRPSDYLRELDWCQGSLYVLEDGREKNYANIDPDSPIVACCALGAICLAKNEGDIDVRQAREMLCSFRNRYGVFIQCWNDHGARSKAEVIERLEAMERQVLGPC